MHEQVELPAERLPHLGENARDVLVGADVAGGDERARHGLGELAHAPFDALALEGERKLGAVFGQPLRDRPGNRALVGDPENETSLPLEHRATLA